MNQTRHINFLKINLETAARFKAICLFCFFILPSILLGYDYELAVCTIFKDNAPYLKEWIEYHHMLGVEHFYLYDNSSTDNPHQVLKPYIKKGLVTLIEWPNRKEKKWGKIQMAWVRTTQMTAYSNACQCTKGIARWLAIIDTDEFIVPVEHKSITSFLKQHEDAPGIYLYWQVYGTSHIYDVPQGELMIELLTLKCPTKHHINGHTKIILQPERFSHFTGSPHYCTFKKAAEPYIAPIAEARINHYINRTEKFFYEGKIKAKETMDNNTWSQDDIQRWSQLGNNVEDKTIFEFIPELKARLGFE